MAAHPRLDALDGPSSPERLAALGHLEACGDCRARWLDEEPARVFALLAVAAVPAEDLDRLTARLDEALAEPRDARSHATRMRHGWAAGLALAAAAALACALGLYLGLREGAGPPLAAAPFEPVDARPMAAEVRVLSPAAADVINLQAGDTQVVMIFDEALDL